MADLVTAADLARARDIDPKRFRSELRKSGFSWHQHNERWTVERGGEQHRDMERIPDRLV